MAVRAARVARLLVSSGARRDRFRNTLWDVMCRLQIEELTYREPDMTWTINLRDQVIARALFVTGSYQAAETGRCLRLLEGYHSIARPVIVDVGANIGTLSLPLVRSGAFGRALCFEPEGLNFDLLSRNIAQNGLSETCAAVRVACSSSSGTGRLHLSGENLGAHTLLGGDGAEFGEHVPVRIERLDSLVAEAGVSASDIGLIHSDTEGHEAAVLEGAAGLLEADIPVVVEFCPDHLRSHDGLESLIRTAAEHFSYFVDLAKGRPVCRPVAELWRVAESLDASDPSHGHPVTDVLLTKRQPPAISVYW